MTDRLTVQVFFDASCLIAAAGSPTGGSSRILSLCAHGLLRGAASQMVLLEAERNIAAKLPPAALDRFDVLLRTVPLQIAPLPRVNPDPDMAELVGDKDAHVLGAALALRVPYLLSLDRRLIERINHADRGVYALTPGDFITTVLTTLIPEPRPADE